MGLDAIIASCAALMLTGLVYSFRHVLFAKQYPVQRISTATAEARHAALEEMRAQLNLVEAELRRLGWWLDSSHSPSPRDSAKLFDGLPFPHWLQYEFLPHARSAVQKGELPSFSGVGLAAMRQYDYHAQVPEAFPLVSLLQGFDDLFDRARHAHVDE